MADDEITRPDTADPLWNFAFDQLGGLRGEMGQLRDTTNHRLDDFHEALSRTNILLMTKADTAKMEIIEERIEQEIALKAGKTELIVPVMGRMLDSWPKRFVAFASGIVASTTLLHFFWDKLF